MRKILLGYVLSAGLLASGAAMAQGYQAQPSCDWDCNWGFSGFYDLRDQASLIESQKEGGFGSANISSTTNSTTTVVCEPGESGAFTGGCSTMSGGQNITTGAFVDCDQKGNNNSCDNNRAKSTAPVTSKSDQTTVDGNDTTVNTN